MRSPVTIRDIASAAGVSRMTVSRVLNSPSKVAPETRERVQQAIEQAGFRPDPVAQQLAFGATRRPHAATRIAVTFPAALLPRLGEFMTAALGAANREGMELVPLAIEDAEPLDERILRARADAVLVLPGADMPRVPRSLPVVAMGEALRGAALVSIDQEASAAALARHLLLLGHQRLTFLSDGDHTPADKARLEGLHAAFEAFGLSVEHRIATSGSGEGFREAGQLLDQPHAPTAIVASREELAIACLSAAYARGLSVPQELTIAWFDDYASAGPRWAEMARVVPPVGEMCRAAFALLAEAIEHARAGAHHKPLARVVLPAIISRRGGFAPARLSAAS